MILNPFETLFSQNLRSNWVHFFSHAEPGYRKYDELTTPPPAQPYTFYNLSPIDGV